MTATLPTNDAPPRTSAAPSPLPPAPVPRGSRVPLVLLALFVLVMGGMFAGFFTATEGAAIGAAGTLVIALLKRDLTWRKLSQCLANSYRVIPLCRKRFGFSNDLP